MSHFSRRSFLRSAAISTATAALAMGCQPKPDGTSAGSASQGQPLKLGMNLWAGFMPWQVAKEKGFLETEKLNAELTWFPVLSDQLSAFNAGKIDVIGVTMSDFLVGLAGGVKAKILAVTDVSLGADAILAVPSITSIKDLVGKRASVEIGTVGHLLFLKALESAGVSADQVQIINQPADAATAALIAGKTDCAYSYEPFISQAVQAGKGKVIFSSKDVPGIIPDLLIVQERVLAQQPEAVQAVLDVWYQTLAYHKDHLDEVLPIEAEQAGVSPKEYGVILDGFKWLTPEECLKALSPGDTMESVVYSSQAIGDFMVSQALVDSKPASIEPYIDTQFVKNYSKGQVAT